MVAFSSVLSLSALLSFAVSVVSADLFRAWFSSCLLFVFAAELFCCEFSLGRVKSGSLVPVFGSCLEHPVMKNAVVANNNSAKLTWLDNFYDETGFVILRATRPDMQFKQIQSLAANTNTYTDNAVIDGVKNFYKVYAYNNSYGQSGVTNSDSVLFA